MLLAASLATGVAEPSRQKSIVPSPDEATWRSGWSVDGLRELFQHGKPSNELREVGLTIHSFDGSEHYQQPWKPCTTDGWCTPFRTWWSASVVNAKNGHAVSDSGILLAPKHTRVLCSAANATALGVDCTGAHHTLRQMLETSLDESASASALANEVRFDSQHYVRQLPDSVAGFFYFDDAETPELVEAARSKASRAYLAFLREYRLTEADVPLLRVSRDPLSLSKGAGVNAVVDESKMARESLRRHTYDRFRSHHRGLHLPESPPDDFGNADNAGAASEAGRPDGKASPHSPDRLRSSEGGCDKDTGCSPANWTMSDLKTLFSGGKPSNDLREIGLMVHGFDGMEDVAETWKPCMESWCDKGDNVFDGEKLNAGLHWWSGSVVSQRNFNTYGKAGLVLAPARTSVMCSFYSDFGTFDRGCATAGLRDSGAIVPYPPDKLRQMLKISYSDENVENAMYNEILIDAKQYIATLPGSIAAVVWFYDEGEVGGVQEAANDQARMEATKAYIGILDAYGLSEDQLPLVKIIRPAATPCEAGMCADKSKDKGILLVDKSAVAREFYSKAQLATYRMHRPQSSVLSQAAATVMEQARHALKTRPSR